MRALSLLHLFLLVVLCACNSETKRQEFNLAPQENKRIQHAQRFSFFDTLGGILATVHAPWQHASETSFSYFITDSGNSQAECTKWTKINSPLNKVVIMSTTYIGMLDALDELESIKGISGAQYVYNAKLNKRIDAGQVRDVGYDHSLNYELLLEIEPDAIFMYGINAGISQAIHKLEEMGIPVIICADYLEKTPLARSEWLKFFSLFFGKQDLAEKQFREIEYRYDSLRQTVLQKEYRKTVMLGLPWKDTWYVAGGNSYAARFIQDAGASYIWKDIFTDEAVPYDIEAVFLRSLDADVWLNTGVAENKADILAHDERFSELKAFKSGEMYNNNLRQGRNGGNDYWESGVLHPDLVLEDLIRILYQSTPVDSFNYYIRLN